MKTKTLKEINEQTARILCNITKTPLSTSEQVARMRKVSAIAERYRINATEWLTAVLSPAELDEYFSVTAIPASVYMINQKKTTKKKNMRIKSRSDLLHQVCRMADLDRDRNGVIWYCGVSDMNTERANKVWHIFGRYQENIIRALGYEPIPRQFSFRRRGDVNIKFPASVYAR